MNELDNYAGTQARLLVVDREMPTQGGILNDGIVAK